MQYPGGTAGWVDYADSKVATGWACNKSFPNSTVTIQARWDTDVYPIGSVSANIPREDAVANACGGSSSAHRFSITVDKNIQDGTTHQLHIYVYDTGQEPPNSPIAVKFSGAPVPAKIGDIVGRDLNIPGVNWTGHVGMWNGTGVIEVLNGQPNAAQINSWDSFNKAAWVYGTGPWKTLSPAYISNSSIWGCFSTICINDWTSSNYPYSGKTKGTLAWAATARGVQISQIGSDYSYTTFVTVAVPSTIYQVYGFRASYPPQRGKYRCDEFIKDLLAATTGVSFTINGYYFNNTGNPGIPVTGTATYTSTVMDPFNNTWSNKILSVENLVLMTPVTLYNEISSILK